MTPTRAGPAEWSTPCATEVAWGDRSGLEFLQAVMSEVVPRSPMLNLLGGQLTSVDEGWVTLRMDAVPQLYGPHGGIHDGAIAALLDSAMDCAVQSTLRPGRRHSTLELNLNLLHRVTAESSFVVATGNIVELGDRQVVVQGRLSDADGRLCAMASATCLLLEKTDLVGHNAEMQHVLS